MCGLYGSIGLPPDERRIDMVAHRGPDGRGWQVFDSAAGPVALGHRRLAIIDTSDAGLQPMADPSGRCHLVFNGEIYNYLELREELRARGEVFASHSDSEVLLRAYMVWGEDCLPRLRGMFAFLIWDSRSRRLFAGRDRYGIKPLYMAGSALSGGDGLALASEIKQLLGLPGVSGRMNTARVHDYLASGVSDHTAETLFEGVRQLRGGECVTVDAASDRPVVAVRRWYPIGAEVLQLSEEKAAERFHHLLQDSVRLHLRSDVPIGSCLSGGLDSSSIVCLMSRLMPLGEQVNTISACYDDKSVDERPFMEAVVAHAGASPFYIFPRAEDVFARASDITWHQDEPFGSTSIFAQWCVFEEARRVGVKVMLDGQGADEQLAGYHFGFPYYLSHLARHGRFLQLALAMLERRRLHGIALPEQIKRAFVPLLPSWAIEELRRRRHGIVGESWLDTEHIRAYGNPDGAMAVATRTLGLETPRDLRSLCMAMTFASNLQMLLHWEDRNSMAHSIEARVPFLDHPLVEFSLALGNNHKTTGADTKRVLRRAMTGVLPQAVRERRDKLGFQTPETAWFRGPLRGMIHDGVNLTLAKFPGLLNAKAVRRLRDAMLGGHRPVDPTLWRIVNLGIWGEKFSVRW